MINETQTANERIPLLCDGMEHLLVFRAMRGQFGCTDENKRKPVQVRVRQIISLKRTNPLDVQWNTLFSFVCRAMWGQLCCTDKKNGTPDQAARLRANASA